MLYVRKGAMMPIEFLSVASYVPPKVVTNDELSRDTT